MQFPFNKLRHSVHSYLRLFLLLCTILFTANAEAACPADTTDTYSSSATLSGFNVGNKKVCITGATTIVTVSSMLGSDGQVYVTNGARADFSGGGVAVNRFYLDVDGSSLVTITNGAFNSTTIFVHGGQVQATGGSFSCRSIYVMPGSTFTRNNAAGSESVNTSGLYNLGTLSVNMNSSTIFDSELYNGTGGTFTFAVPNFLGTNGKRTSSVNMTGSSANALTIHTITNDFSQYTLPDCSTSTAGATASAIFSATANPTADLAVTKTNSVSSVTTNSSTIYTITVTNNGPSAAIATLTDPAVTGLNKTAVACSTTPGVCVTPPSVASLQAGFNTPSIPSGGTYQIRVTATVTATSGSVANTATVAPPTGTTDPTTSNNSSTDTDNVIPSANLGVTKTDSITTVNAGATTNYIINVTNSGPSPSVAILTDPAVTGLNVTAVTCHTTPGVCLTPPSIANLQAGFSTPSIPVGGTYQIRVTATVTATSGTVTNTAIVTPPSGSVDLTPANDSSTDTNNVTPLADLAIVKTDGSTTASSGSSIVYTVTVTNNGPSPSTTTLRDLAATGLTKTAVTCGATPGVCTTPPTVASLEAGFITPIIPSGGSYQLNVTTTVTALSGNVTNTATVTAPSGTTDPTAANNSSSDTDNVVLTADLAIVKTNGVNTVNAGSSTIYTLTVTNNGPSAATARLTDPAVTGLNKTAVACGTTPGVCSTAPTIANLQAGFTTPSIPSGGSYQLRVTATVTATNGSIANTATVAPPVGTTDPNNSNDSSTDTDTVTPVAPITVQNLCESQLTFTTAAAANTANGLLDYTKIYTGAVGVYENVGGLGIDLVLQARNQDGSALSGGLTLDPTTSGIYHNTAPWRLDIAYYRTGTNQIIPASTANFTLSLEDFEENEGIRIPSVLDLSSTELGPINIRDDTSVIYNPGVASPGPSYSADGQTILGFFPTGGGVQTGKWTKIRLPTSDYHKLTIMVEKFGGNNSVLRLCSPYASSADIDRSDAPASYTEAWHDYTPNTLRLGSNVDFDDAAIMSIDALGDGADDDAPNVKAATTDFSITNTDSVVSVTPSSSLNYLITITNNGPDTSTVILTNPAATGLNKTAVACGTTPGVCVTPPTIANLQAGFTTPNIPLGGTYQLRVTTTVTASSGSVANTATVTAPVGTTDPTNTNNSSTDTNIIADYGDAPSDLSTTDAALTQIYNVLNANSGAAHIITSGVHLGTSINSEVDGQPTTAANADTSDDGVTFPTTPDGKSLFYMGETNTVTVNASTNGYLNVWFDWNEDGVWDIAERVANDTPVTAGNNTLSITVGNSIPVGSKYARFRFCTSTSTCNTPSGVAANGEVEDYRLDYLAFRDTGNKCNALIDGSFEQGMSTTTYGIYSETIIPGWATTPDLPTGWGFAQRNAIEIWSNGFLTVPSKEGNYFAEINAYVNGTLHQDLTLPPTTTVSWSFWHRGRNGVDAMNVLIGTPSEVIQRLPSTVQASMSSPAGTWTFYSGSYTVPAGQYVTRFGFHSVSTATGDLSSGNLIDDIQLGTDCKDHGDAPNTYQTSNSNNGAYHQFTDNPTLYIGTQPDREADGIPSVNANSDDNNNIDDENGVSSFPIISTANTSYSIATRVTNTSGQAATLLGWIDFNRNGLFDSNEAAMINVPNGSNNTIVNLNWSGLSSLTVGKTYVRLRLTSDSNVATGNVTTSKPYGLAGNGEVEDYSISIANSYDFSDAPASYGVPAHAIITGIQLGTNPPDAEGTSLASPNANSDDNTTTDDEDGVSNFPALNTDDQTYSLNVLTTNTSGSPARLVGWIDFNRNGVFDSNEAATSNVANGVSNRVTALTWSTLPPDTVSGASFLRLRLTGDSTIATGTASTSQPNGVAFDGEVEDYPITIGNSGFNISGKVYHDTNANGVNNSETGLQNITIVLYDTAANTCRSTKTAADGRYHFNQVQPAAANNYVVYEAAAESLPTPSMCPPVATDPNSYLSTTSNTVVVTVSAASVHDIDFGDVQKPSFTLEHSQAILPGSTVIYPHIFNTSANGSVNFSLVSSADPANLAWNVVLYRDASCNAELDTGDTPLTGSVAVSADDSLCLLAKVLSPSNASSGTSHTLAITSQFTFGNGSLITSPVEQTRTDLTRTNAGTPTNPVDGAGKLKLSKSVWNVTRNINGDVALPGETLRYTIAYENIGNGQLNELIVQDSVPAYTQLVGGSQQCGILPLGLFSCTPTVTGDAITWTLEGQVQPGTQGELFFDVIIKE